MIQAAPAGKKAKAGDHAGGGEPCYHCGTPCLTEVIRADSHTFCCEGCRLVYELLSNNGLCDYYRLQDHPGLGQIRPRRREKFAYLDDPEIASSVYSFSDGNQTVVTWYIPGIHCASCMWLLENMHRLDRGISESRLHFSAKELTIRFSAKDTSLRRIAELLTTIGYEPYISLESETRRKGASYSKRRIYKLGIAGFCFGNIMLMSFPEYLSARDGIGEGYERLFRILNLALSLPVFLYCASEFFTNAWKGIRQKMLNIDAPIALALLITFSRSIYEIISGTGAGYLDSMTGIVFFMLAGRIVQERTWQSLSFHRDYKSYFPLAVQVVTPEGTVPRKLGELKTDDLAEIHHDEIIPADAVVAEGRALIDYSFVTGESTPVEVACGGQVYAGGRQTGGRISVRITRPVSESYLTSLWNHSAFSGDKSEQQQRDSVIHRMSKYFTLVLFSLAALTAVYWLANDPSRIWQSVSAMLIVACPCALLLVVTFTNGNLLRMLSNNGLYLRDAAVIEQMGGTDHIVFDKTGTLTSGHHAYHTDGHTLQEEEKQMVYSLIAASQHPYSQALKAWLGPRELLPVQQRSEETGKGISGYCNGIHICIGSPEFTGAPGGESPAPALYIRTGAHLTAFHTHSDLRTETPGILSALHSKEYKLSLLTGDNDRERALFSGLFGTGDNLKFRQKPEDKLEYVRQLQQSGARVLMIGDGLNDAGALRQSDTGITLAEDINNFTPSCDAILDASQLAAFPALLELATSGKRVIRTCFIVSILYNLAGISIAASGNMSPLIAAILMPASTLTTVLLTVGIVRRKTLRLGLRTREAGT